MDDPAYGNPTQGAPEPPGYGDRVTRSNNQYYYGEPPYQPTGRNSAPGYTWRNGRWAQSVDGSTRNDPNIDPIDYDKRDPNDLNSHVKLVFSEIIGEPEGAHSGDCIWRNSYNCFHAGSNCCYLLLTYLCAIPAAFCWGCHFACLTFTQIWCVTPYLRAFNIGFYCIARQFSAYIHCLFDPAFEAASLLFTKIFVNNIPNSQPYAGRSFSQELLIKTPKSPEIAHANRTSAVVS